MFDFKGITHVIENPAGHAPGYNYSLVGSVPCSMLDGHTPNLADIMGGRVAKDGLAYSTRKWETIQQIREVAAANGVHLCDVEGCACRRLLNEESASC